MLEIAGLRAGYDGTDVLHGLDLSLQAGEMVGLLGPNGSGKSTLLRVVAGLLVARAGRVILAGRELRAYAARDRAKLIGLVPQFAALPFAFSVGDVVAMGRHPYIGLLGAMSAHDRQAVELALDMADVSDLRERLVTELSGGEFQRVLIARALAQEPRLLLLDEPTAHLDLNHQVDIALLMGRLNHDQGLTILWVSHDVNLAGEFCDRLLMLKGGELVADGTPAETITPAGLRQVYGMDFHVAPSPLSGRPQVVLSRGSETR
jgi:iron complex transport system ATP-binding protein